MAYPDDPREIFLDLFVNDEWVDIKDFVHQGSTITVSRGSGGEDNSTPPTTLSLALYNGDGRFTQDNPLSPYYPYIGQSTQIRYGVVYNSTNYTRFVGEVSTWPMVVDNVAEVNVVSVQAGGIFRRWSRQLPLDSPLRRTIPIADTVVAYWPMEDEGANANRLASGLIGRSAMVIKNPIEVASYDGFVGSKAVPDIGTGYVWGSVAPHTPAANNQYVFTFLYNGDAPGSDATFIADWYMSGDITYAVAVMVDIDGDLRVRIYQETTNATTTASGNFNVNDKNCMIRLQVEEDGSDVDYVLTVYTEGELPVTQSGTFSNYDLGIVTRVVFGQFNDLDANVGQAAVFAGVPANDGNIIEAFYGYAGETAGERYLRTCGENNITARIIGDPALTPRMGPQPIGTVFDVLKECVDVDHSLLFETRDEFGCTFLTRNALYNQSSAKRLAPDITIFGDSGTTSAVYLGPDAEFHVWPGTQFKIHEIADDSLLEPTLFTVTNVITYVGDYTYIDYEPASLDVFDEVVDKFVIYRNGLLEVNVDDDNEVLSPLSPVRDDRFTTNEVTVQRTEGSEYTAVELTGPRSIQDPPNGIGRYNTSTTLNVYSDGDVRQHATWLLGLGIDDSARWPNVQLGFHTEPWINRQEELLSVDVGHRMVIESLESIDVYDPSNQLIRGYAESFDGNKMHYISFNDVSERLYHVLEFDNTELDCRWAAADGSTALGEPLTTTQTGAVDVTVGATEWTTDAGDFPLDIMIDGERVTLSDINGSPSGPSFVASGASDSDNNASLTPGMPGGVVSGDVVFIVAGIRRASLSATSPSLNVPNNWSAALNYGHFALLYRVYNGVWTMPTVTFSGGASGDTTLAMSCAFRNCSGVEIPSAASLIAAVPGFSNFPIDGATFASMDTVNGQLGLRMFIGMRNDDWTSAAPPNNFTEIGELTSTLGNDAGIVWAYDVSSTSRMTSDYVLTGGGTSASSWHAMTFFGSTPQEFVISARSVNGVVKAHSAGATVDVADPFYYGL